MNFFIVHKIQKAVRGLNHPDKAVREKSIAALVRHSDTAFDTVLETLKNPDRISAANAAITLGKIGNPSAVEPLIVMLNKCECVKDYLTQKSAVEALSMILDARAIEPLITLFTHEDADVRESALNALIRFGNASVDALIGALEHQATYIRSYSAVALGEIKNPRAVPALINALEDKSRYDSFIVRKNAARALGKIAAVQSVKPLMDALHDAYKYVRQAAADSLQSITGKSFGVDFDLWKTWWNKSDSKKIEN